MISKSLRRMVQTMKSSRVRYAAIFAALVLVLVFGAVQASGPMRPPHPPQPPQNDGMWGMKMPSCCMPKWGSWMPWMPSGPVPEIHIIAVFEDLIVFFETENFPENEDFTVTMGEMYTQGIDGIEIGTFNSADGSPQIVGAYIPADLYGLDRIAIRAQTGHESPLLPYYAYNWFYNTTALAPEYATTLEGMSADQVAAQLQSAEGLIELDSMDMPAADTESAEEAPAAEAESTEEAPAAETESTEGVGGADDAEEAAAESELTGVSWQWTEFSDPVQGALTIDTPEQYTVEFTPEGLVGVKADCNNGSGTYIADEEGGIDIALGIVTAAACAPESLSDQFLQYLGEVAAYSFADGSLVLDLPADGGTMSFAAGEAAAPAEGEAEAAEETEAEAPAEGEAAEAPTEETEAAEEGEAAASVTGTVTYLQRIALPDDAVVTVQVRDTSLADAPAVVMGEQVIETAGQQVPIPYEVAYNPDEIVDNFTYTMSARIEDAAGNLLFINDTAIPVITRDNPTEDVEIMTVQVAEAPAEGEAETTEEGEAEAAEEGEAEAAEEATTLTGVVWQWTEFSDPVQGALPVENPEQYTVEFLEDGTAAVKLDCNSGSGSYVADEEGSIDVTIGAVTLALCEEDSLGDQFQQYLDAAAVYFFEEGDLLMDLPVDSGTLRFAAAADAEAGATAKLASLSMTPVFQDNGEEEEATVPSFSICTVVRGETVYIEGENFPADQTFTVKMGVPQVVKPMYKHPMPPKPMPYGAPMKEGPMKPDMGMGMPNMGKPMNHSGNMWMEPAPKIWIPYYEVDTLETGEGGEIEATFEIPAELAGAYKINILMITDDQFPYMSYNWFYNNDAEGYCNGENGEG